MNEWWAIKDSRPLFLAMLCAITLIGCSIGGSWRVIETDPPGSLAPVSVVTFGPDHDYTVTWSHEGRTRTGVGRYRWGLGGLEMTGTDRLPPPDSARVRADGKLLLTYRTGDEKVVATLEKMSE